MSKEQAAIKDESGAEPPEQSNDAQDDDLDSLLAEHDQPEDQNYAQPAAAGGGDNSGGGGDDRIDQIYQFIQQQEQRTQTEETNKAISQAVKTIKEIVGTESLEDDDVEVALQGWASKDARITKAFYNRHKNPAAWNAALKMVAGKIKKYAPDDDDREHIAAAVRSGSTAKAESERDFPSDKEIKNMSDADYQKMLKDIVKD